MKETIKKLLLTVPLCLSLGGASVFAQAAGSDEDVLAKRAKAYGSLAYLPASTEGAVTIRDLAGMFNTIVDSNVFKQVVELASGGDADLGFVAQARQAVATYAGDEIVVAYSEGSATELKRLMSIYDTYVRVTYGALGRGLASGNFRNGAGMDPEQIMATVKKLLGDADSPLSKALDEFQMPPILLGSKMPDAAAALVAQLNELEGQLPPFVTVSSFQVGDAAFKSWSIELKDVFDENAQSQMEETLGDKALSDRVAKAIRGKRVEASFGVMGDHLVVALGKDHSHLKFVENPAESLISLPQFAKADAYLGKHLHGYIYASKTLLEADDSAKMIRTMADAFAEGLAADGPPVMKKLGGYVKQLGDQLTRLTTRKAGDYLGVMYGEEGLHGEGFGGWVADATDGKAKLTFANSGIDDAFLIIDTISNPEYDKIGIEMIETLAAAADVGVRVYGKVSGDEDSVGKYKEMKKIFAPKLKKIWGILTEKCFAGLGSESAMIMDLKGTLPKIPGVPRVIVNQGKAPRIALANTVKDRKLLGQAWEELVPALNDLMASIPGQEQGAEVQIPDTISSNKDGLATHYFGLPFLSNDFMPSLSISDKLFFLSTSKQFSESIAEKVGKGSGDLRGSYCRIDFDQLNEFAQDWLELVLKNKDQVFDGNEFAAESFVDGAEIAKKAITLARVLKSFEFNKHTTDSDEGRSTWHLHLKDVK